MMVHSPRRSAYVNSKAALVHWTSSLAVATEAHGIRVFAIDPGTMTVQTGMQRYLTETDRGRRYFPRRRAIAEAGSGLPPERAARLIVALATGAADALMGRFIRFDDDLVRSAEAIRRDDLRTLRIRP